MVHEKVTDMGSLIYSLWRLYGQPYIQEDGSVQSIVIVKAHHALSDGISIMCMNLFMSAEYDRSFFVKTKDATWLETLFVRLSSIVQIPLVLISSMMIRPDVNFITKDKKKRMSGVLNCQSTNELKLPEIKELSKKLGVTINDIVTCAISTTFKQVFEEKNEKVNEINVFIPANIRFKFYKTR